MIGSGWSEYNGLIVPNRISLEKRQELDTRQKTQRGRFFSSYAFTQNSTSYGYTKPANTTSFEALRMLKEKSIIDNIIINARIMQMKHIAKRNYVPGKTLGFRVVHENYADPNYKPDKNTLARCKEMERIIDNVNTNIHPAGFRDFAAIAVDQELTIDRKAMVIAKDRTNAPIRYHLVDGATIRPMLEVLFDYMDQKKIVNKERAMIDFWAETKIDLSTAAYVQIVDGHAVASWTAEEMNIDITNPSVEINKWAYGAGSMLEKSLGATVTWLNAWSYNDGLFQQDSPESLLFLYGDYDPVGLDAFQRQILDQTGSGDYQKLPVIPADQDFKAELVKIRELPKDLQFAEFLRMIVQIKTASYRAHPSIVNMSIDKGSGGGISIGNQNEDEIVKQAHEEGFETLAENLCVWLTRTIIKPRYDDLVMILDTDTDDEIERVELINKQTEVAMTFNEARRAQGFEGDLEYGDIPNNSVYVQYMTAQMNMKMQQQQMKQQQSEQQANRDHAQFMDMSDKQHQASMKEKDIEHQTNMKTQEIEARRSVDQEKNQAKQKNPQKVKGTDMKKSEKVLMIEILG